MCFFVVCTYPIKGKGQGKKDQIKGIVVQADKNDGAR